MFFNFFGLKTKKQPIEKFNYSISRDIHAHLIPGVDDGPKTMAEALRLVKGFQNLGFKRITATPHIHDAYYPNEKDQLIDAFAKFTNAIAKKGYEIEVDLAAEYFLDGHFGKLLRKNELLPLAKNYLLVEMPYIGVPPKLREYFFTMQTSGYKPILAHPERYVYLEMKDYADLLDYGTQFQVNLLSFAGYYGKETQKRAFALLERGWIHAVGSDVHNEEQLVILGELLSDIRIKDLAEKPMLNEFI